MSLVFYGPGTPLHLLLYKPTSPTPCFTTHCIFHTATSVHSPVEYIQREREREMGVIILYVIIFLVSLFSFIFSTKDRRAVQKGVKLPPGSMGWPYIGETLQLYSRDPNVFFATKQNRSPLSPYFF